jgi:hypothetical protein
LREPGAVSQMETAMQAAARVLSDYAIDEGLAQ